MVINLQKLNFHSKNKNQIFYLNYYFFEIIIMINIITFYIIKLKYAKNVILKT